MYSVSFLGAITTPAACMEVWRMLFSSFRAYLISLTNSALRLISRCSSGLFSMTSFSSTLGPSGIILASRLTSASLISMTRPMSRMASLAFMRPKVTIWATLSSPYLARMYSMTSSRRSASKSMSMSGRLTRSGLRKRSKIRSYSSGSMLVMPMTKATRLPTTEPRPGPTGMPLSLAKRMMSQTMRK